jgi:hypothetical protein
LHSKPVEIEAVFPRSRPNYPIKEAMLLDSPHNSMIDSIDAGLMIEAASKDVNKGRVGGFQNMPSDHLAHQAGTIIRY